MKKTLSAVAGVAFAAGLASGVSFNPGDAVGKGKLFLDPSRASWQSATVKNIAGTPMVQVCLSIPYNGGDGGVTESRCSKDMFAPESLAAEIAKSVPAAKKSIGLE